MSGSSEGEHLPDTLVYGKGLKMTFLRNESYMVRNYISGAPDADTLYVPLHWHETHDEFMRVLEGELEITLGSSTRLYGPEDGEVKIPRGVVHSLKTHKGVACIFEEKTEPMDEEKKLFFRNMLWRGTYPTNLFEVMQVFYHGDTRPAFPGHFSWLEKTFVTVVGGWTASILGHKLKYEHLKQI